MLHLVKSLTKFTAIGTISLMVFTEMPVLARPLMIQDGEVQLIAARQRSPRRRNRVRFRVGVRPSRYRVGGFSRNSQCGVGEGAKVVAPPEKAGDRAQATQNNIDFVEQTTADKPTFFVYLPQESGGRAKLTVQNEARDEQLDRVTFDLKPQAGIVAIPMSAQAKPLQVGQKYLWQMTIYCDATARQASVTLSGWVERVSPAAVPEDLEERVSFYADRGIWQDAMAGLMALKGRSGEAEWAALMESAELGDLRRVNVVQVVGNP
jgi:Domain of Unknown Function (DUF928)